MTTYIRVLYDYSYENASGRTIALIKGERFQLIQKSNTDWWKVLRDGENKPMYVPANYVELISPRSSVIDGTKAEPDVRKVDQNANSQGSVDANSHGSVEATQDVVTDEILSDSVASSLDGDMKSVESLDQDPSEVYVNLATIRSQLSLDESEAVDRTTNDKDEDEAEQENQFEVCKYNYNEFSFL